MLRPEASCATKASVTQQDLGVSSGVPTLHRGGSALAFTLPRRTASRAAVVIASKRTVASDHGRLQGVSSQGAGLGLQPKMACKLEASRGSNPQESVGHLVSTFRGSAFPS